MTRIQLLAEPAAPMLLGGDDPGQPDEPAAPELLSGGGPREPDEPELHSSSDSDVDDDEDTGLIDTNERVSEALRNVHSIADEITITDLHTDLVEGDFVSNFMSVGCGCVKRCWRQFSLEYVTSVRSGCTELTRGELDMAILGQVMASTNTRAMVSTVARHREAERQRSHTSFSHQGKAVCTRMFLFLHTIGMKRLKNLLKSFKENGLTPRVHGNIRRKPKHALSFASTEYVVRFLHTYAEQHDLLLPGRIPGYSRSDIQQCVQAECLAGVS